MLECKKGNKHIPGFRYSAASTLQLFDSPPKQAFSKIFRARGLSVFFCTLDDVDFPGRVGAERGTFASWLAGRSSMDALD